MTDVAKKMKLHRNWMIPGIKHPLLTAPSAVVEKLEWRDDETVIEVEAAYHRFFDSETADPTA